MRTRQIEGSETPSCVVLVLSCDRYRDLCTPFFTQFRRHWPDCNMPVFLGTDSASVNPDWVRTLRADTELAWSQRLRLFLNNLEYDYVLLLLEDFFLDTPVSNEQVSSQLNRLHSLQGASLRLFPNPPADYFRDGIGVMHSAAQYRVSLQAGIWNRAILRDLLRDGESPWEFEIRGSRRSRKLAAQFYCTGDAVVHYRHVVERGEWFRADARFYARQNIGCDFKARRVMGFFKTVKKHITRSVRRILNRAHSRWLCLSRPEK